MLGPRVSREQMQRSQLDQALREQELSDMLARQQQAETDVLLAAEARFLERQRAEAQAAAAAEAEQAAAMAAAAKYEIEMDAYMATLPARVTHADVLNMPATRVRFATRSHDAAAATDDDDEEYSDLNNEDEEEDEDGYANDEASWHRPHRRRQRRSAQHNNKKAKTAAAAATSDERLKRNMHTFCLLEHERRSYLLLPDELLNVTRKNHTRARFEKTTGAGQRRHQRRRSSARSPTPVGFRPELSSATAASSGLGPAAATTTLSYKSTVQESASLSFGQSSFSMQQQKMQQNSHAYRNISTINEMISFEDQQQQEQQQRKSSATLPGTADAAAKILMSTSDSGIDELDSWRSQADKAMVHIHIITSIHAALLTIITI